MLVIEPSKSGAVVHVFWCIPGKVEGRTGTCSVAVMFEVQLASSNECLPTLLHVVVFVDCGVRYVCECACVAYLSKQIQELYKHFKKRR